MSITIYQGPIDESIDAVFFDMMRSIPQVAIQKEASANTMHIQWMCENNSIIDNIAAGFLRSAIDEYALSDRARYVSYAMTMLNHKSTVMTSTMDSSEKGALPSFLNDVFDAIAQEHAAILGKIKKAILAASAIVAMASVAGGVAWVATQPVDKEGMEITTRIAQDRMIQAERENISLPADGLSSF